jgi:hypothetical protein
MKNNFLYLLCLLFLCSCSGDSKTTGSNLEPNKELNPEKATEPVPVSFGIKGMTFTATNVAVSLTNIAPLVTINANWISQVPFAFGTLNSPTLRYDPTGSWWGETDIGITLTTQLAKSQGIKTMLKPQIWLGGSYTGSFLLANENDWISWENNYTDYIMHLARLADSLDIDMFCIGTELNLVVQNRPAYWVYLINSVRSVYRGKIIYAANWDDYQKVLFWDKLDYIGVDGYFPLSKSETPSVKEIVSGWQSHIVELEKYRATLNKDIIFTEVGYKSVDQCANEPWNSTSTKVNLQAQSNALQGFFEAFNNKTWFAGVFLWKWYPDHEKSGGASNGDYTPQHKPAELIITKSFQ